MKYFLIVLLSLFTLSSCKSKKKMSQEEAPKVEEQAQESQEETKEIQLPSMEDLSAEDRQNYELIQAELTEDVFAQIRRTPCFGRCPTYTLTVFFSGEVLYKGERNVDKIGMYRAKVDQEVLAQLRNRAEQINFFKLQYFYDNKNVTDLPSTITSVRNAQEIKTIVSRFNEPTDLRAFNKYFDQLFESVDWQKVEEK